jgi:hypothetical protein
MLKQLIMISYLEFLHARDKNKLHCFFLLLRQIFNVIIYMLVSSEFLNVV